MEALPKIEGEIMECAFYDLPEDTAITRVGWGEVRDAIAQARAEGAREALAGVPEVVREAVEAFAAQGEKIANTRGWIRNADAVLADVATLRAWLASLPPHDATGSQEVGC